MYRLNDRKGELNIFFLVFLLILIEVKNKLKMHTLEIPKLQL